MLTVAPNVLAARLPRSWAVTAALVVGAAGLTALAAQWVIPLPFTPVPITGQTFAVLLTGAALGMKAGAAGQALYLLMGAGGLPVFQGQNGGIEYMTGGTIGYLFGFVIAAAVVGKMAEHDADRTFPTMLTAFLAGSAIIYTFGVIGLMGRLGWDASEAMAKGVIPFLFGDLLKATAAGLLLPGAHRLADRRA